MWGFVPFISIVSNIHVHTHFLEVALINDKISCSEVKTLCFYIFTFSETFMFMSPKVIPCEPYNKRYINQYNRVITFKNSVLDLLRKKNQCSREENSNKPFIYFKNKCIFKRNRNAGLLGR